MFFDQSAIIKKLGKKSLKIVNVFTETIAKLNRVNDDVEENLIERDHEIARIQAEQTELNGIKTENQKMIDKLKKILE